MRGVAASDLRRVPAYAFALPGCAVLDGVSFGFKVFETVLHPLTNTLDVVCVT